MQSVSCFYLLDADAFHCLRSLGAIRYLLDSKVRVRLVLTEYVARHELSMLAEDVARLESVGALEIKPVSSRDPDYKQLQKEVDKGEAEAMAWLLKQARDERPFFISNDKKALRTARSNRIKSGDILDMLIDLMDTNALHEDAVREILTVWEDKKQQRGRPADFTTFRSSVAQRRVKLRWRAA
jgi:predicted nucleic acid-binding protein